MLFCLGSSLIAVFDETLLVFSKECEPEFLPILASIVKNTLQHKDGATDANHVKRNPSKIFLEYCENPANNIQQTKEIKAGICVSENIRLR